MVKDKIKKLLMQLYEGVYEREEALRLALLASLAGESIFLLGPPGVAKSLVARRLKFIFQDAASFEYLMSRFSTPDEVFGPVSIKQLKDHDSYVRLTNRYLPGAQVVFLDEIWKAGPPIQNALLTVLNEKIYRNGDQEITVDLRALISASNELPARNEGLEALWDRFLIRLCVGGIQDRTNFEKMITGSDNLYQDKIDAASKITTKEYQTWSQAIGKIEIPLEVLDVIDLIRKGIVQRNGDKKPEDQIMISDRRWKKIVRLLRACAFANDRNAADLMDCFLIPHCIWNHPSQAKEVWDLVGNIIQKNGYHIGLPIQPLAQAIQDFNDEVQSETQYEKLVKYQGRKVVRKDQTDYYIIPTTNYSYMKVETFLELKKTKKLHADLYDENVYYRQGYTLQYLSETKIGVNGETCDFELEEQEKKERASRKAHPAVQKQWDDTVARLLQDAQALLDKIKNYKKTDQAHITSNLFIPSALATIVFANLETMSKQIQDLKVEIGKIKYYYENLQ